jgi:glycosyltransferase involved in cell wall biosynthesis
MTVLEAMACGVPVVATDGGALPEVVGDDGDGIIVPAKDSRALAAAIARVLADPVLRAELGRRGRERVLKRFTWRRMAAGTAEVYQEAIERNKHAHRRLRSA